MGPDRTTPNNHYHQSGISPGVLPSLRNLWIEVNPYGLTRFCECQQDGTCGVVDSLHYSTLILCGMVSPLDGVGAGFTIPQNGMLRRS